MKNDALMYLVADDVDAGAQQRATFRNIEALALSLLAAYETFDGTLRDETIDRMARLIARIAEVAATLT